MKYHHRLTQKERITRRLEEGPATAMDFFRLGVPCYQQRVAELRADGLTITCTRNDDGIYEYEMAS